MNDYLYVGKIVNTFGIKGELKVISDFDFKDRVFSYNFNIYIGEEKNKEIINTHRVHKKNDLITLIGYNNINEVLKYKGTNIYILRNDLEIGEKEYLISDLVGYEVYDGDKYLGVVIDYEKMANNNLLKVEDKNSFYLPLIDKYIEKIDKKERKIFTIKGSDLII